MATSTPVIESARTPVRKRTGGTWDPSQRPLYVAATQTSDMRLRPHGQDGQPDEQYHAALVSTHEIAPATDGPVLEAWLAAGRLLLIDSGVHNLIVDVMRATGIHPDDLINMGPATFPGFARLYRRYVETLRTYGPRSWGYFELDFGTAEEIAATRERLEREEGLVPIPIFKMGRDTWDVFDDLCTRYDRVAISRAITGPEAWQFAKVLGTLWEHARHHPGVWIHLLGYAANSWLHSYPFHSSDSTHWLVAAQYAGYHPRIDLHYYGMLPRTWRHIRGVPPDHAAGTRRVKQLAAMGHVFQQRQWTSHAREMADLLGEEWDGLGGLGHG